MKALLTERAEFSIAFHSAFLLPLNGRTATIATPVQFYCQVIEQRADALRTALSEVSGKEIETIEVRLFEPTAAGSE